MITISLDEQGVFENNVSPAGDIVMIAGVVYDDAGDSYDVEREKSRIRKYFGTVCQKVRTVYPQALHIGHAQDNKVKAVKEEYSATLGEFLKEGTYRGQAVLSSDEKPRAGKYYVYALVKSRKGKPNLTGTDVSNLIDENIASNLYMHMVEDVLSRLLFYNNEFTDQGEVAFDLATRVYKGGAGENLSEHIDIGYKTKAVSDGKLVFLTNADVFRTALEREMLSQKDNAINIKSLLARSINYENANAGHELLYMADAVCTCLGFNNGYGRNKPYLTKVWEKMHELSGNNRLLFSYDKVDTGFINAWKWAVNGDIYKALSVEFDTMSLDSEAAGFYEQVWERELLKILINSADAATITMAVRKYFQSTRNNNIDQKKLIFIFERLEKIAENVIFSNSQDKAVLYDLYDGGVSAYNHIGNPGKARECAEKCKHYMRFAGVEREIRNRNKVAISLCDSFRYKEAEELVRASYEYYKTSYEAQKKYFGGNVLYNSVEFGIVCSQLGQIYGYMRDIRAEHVFMDALSLMEEGTADYYITESYLLHYYLQTNNREQYEIYAREYFGGNENLHNQLEYLITEGSAEKNPIISLKFALFVYLKSVVTFYLEEISDELMQKLLNIESVISDANENGKKQIKGHPWEISYKYLAMIAFKAKNLRISADYVKKINTCMKDTGSTIEIIKLFGEVELSKFRTPELNIQNKIRHLCGLIEEINPAIRGMDSFEELEKIVTYTYR